MTQPGVSLIRTLFSLGLLGTLAAICYVLLLPYQTYRRLRSARRDLVAARTTSHAVAAAAAAARRPRHQPAHGHITPALS